MKLGKFIQILSHLIQNINKKHYLSFNSLSHEGVIWRIFITPLNLAISMVTIMVLMFLVAIVLVIYTPILDLIPGYPGTHSRELLLSSIEKIDSLQGEVDKWGRYHSNIKDIFDGNPSPALLSEFKNDSLPTSTQEMTKPTEDEQNFRKLVESREKKNSSKVASFDMFNPINGKITQRYNAASSKREIEITAASSEPVLSISDGTVMFTTWSPNDGYIIQIQHGRNLVSIYKKMSRLLKEAGDRVAGGEVIGYIGDQNSAVSAPSQLQLEIWSDGNSVDPQNYLLY